MEFSNKNIGKWIEFLVNNNRYQLYIYLLKNTELSELSSQFPNSEILIHKNIFSLFRFLKKINVVCWTYSNFKLNILLATFRFIFNYQYIIKTDSIYVDNRKSFYSKIYNCIFFYFPYYNCKLLITESRRILVKASNANIPSLYFPNGVSKGLLTVNSTIIKENLIVYVGRICFEKGLDQFLKSLDYCKCFKLSSYKIIVVGRVFDELYYNECIKYTSFLNLTDNRIEWIQYLKKSELFNLYSRAIRI